MSHKYKVPVCLRCGNELGRYCLIGNEKVCVICYERWLQDGPLHRDNASKESKKQTGRG